jgi:(2R)-ethylmalonyl-CoA mutase
MVKNMKKRGLADIPLVVGGIIPEADMEKMYHAGVKKIYTPKDFNLNDIMMGIVDVVAQANHIELL